MKCNMVLLALLVFIRSCLIREQVEASGKKEKETNEEDYIEIVKYRVISDSSSISL